MTRRTFGSRARASRAAANLLVGSVACEYDGVDGPAAIELGEPLRPLLVSEPERGASGRRRRRGPDVLDEIPVRGSGERGECHIDALAVPTLDRELHPGGVGRDAEPVQDLARDHELRQAQDQARLVVAGDERPDACGNLVDRRVLDRDQASADELRLLGRREDEHAFGKDPDTDRQQVQRTCVGHEREEAHVPVTLPGHRDDAQELDEQLISLELGQPLDDVVDGAAKLRTRDRMKEIRMNPLHLGRELAHVGG